MKLNVQNKIVMYSTCGGGPSTDIETKCSPRSRTNPNVRFSSRTAVSPKRNQFKKVRRKMYLTCYLSSV